MKKYIYIYIYIKYIYTKLNHFAIHQELTQYCKSTSIFTYLFMTIDFKILFIYF